MEHNLEDLRAALAATYPTRRHLTPREVDVVACLLDGGSHGQIAAALCISIKTVEAHKAHVTAKLGIVSTSALVTELARVYWQHVGQRQAFAMVYRSHLCPDCKGALGALVAA